MKKFFALLTVVALAFTLTACAATSAGDGMKVKCPACGHEFNTKAGSGSG